MESKSDQTISKNRNNYDTVIILVLFFPALFVLSAVYFTVPIIVELKLAWNITDIDAAWSSAIFSICFALGCLVYGPISNYYGRKPIIVIGLVSLSIITICCYFVKEYDQFLVLRGLQGAAAASFSPVALTYVAERFPLPKRVLVVGYISMGFLLGGIVGQLVSSFFATYYYWQQLYSWMGVIYGLLALIVMLWLPNIEFRSRDKLSAEADCSVQLVKRPSWNNRLERIVSAAKDFQSKRLMLIYVITFTVLFGFVGCYTILADVLQYQLSSSQILWFRAYGAIGMLICPFVRYIPLSLVTMLRFALSLAILALLLLTFEQQLIVYILISIVFTFSIAWLVPVVIALVGIYGSLHRGLSTSLYTCILFLGAALAPVVATTIVNSSYRSFSFLLFALSYGISLICAMQLPSSKQQEKELII
ncbi:MFS transporter [Paenibacillus endoradicis]|uniref:MFS transporter n=1 Tax=Paenibacillus endoradicis TaxID=2972487 RepID=UPI0021595A3A|nr:MFS transporter [Paenibacillus endoradicis]MCR8659139.1 MFS transporter [Paenibacillus endoradicis]